MSRTRPASSTRSPRSRCAHFRGPIIAAGSLAGGVAVDHAGATGAMHLGVLLSALGLAVLASFATTRRAPAPLLAQ